MYFIFLLKLARDILDALVVKSFFMPGMSERAYRGWESPEEQWNAEKKDSKDFVERVKMILSKKGDARILKNEELLADVLAMKDPYDENECKEIAKKHDGLDPAMIGAIAARMDEEKSVN